MTRFLNKALSLAIVLALLGSAAGADAPALSSSLKKAVVQAMGYLNSGEYERIVLTLPFSDIAPGASEWQSFANGNFHSLGKGGTSSYCLSYFTGSEWYIAVPVSDPEDDSSECLVCISRDGNTCTGYCFSTMGRVRRDAANAQLTE